MTDPESRSTDRGRSAQPGGPDNSWTGDPRRPVAACGLQGLRRGPGRARGERRLPGGEIHALVGENGSGKSTLLGIASGFLAPDEGTVEIGGRPLATASVARRCASGWAWRTRPTPRSSRCPWPRTCISRRPPTPAPAYGEWRRWAARKARGVRAGGPGRVPAGSLSLAERQLLEVVKALLAEPKVLLLDEPTTALGPEEIEQLHALVFERSRAGVGVIYVSHRLPEVLGIADRITVLRDGVSQGTFDAAGMSEDALVALMIGRPLGLAFPDRDSDRCRARSASRWPGSQGERFGPIDLDVHRGEILGIAGAEGNGQVPVPAVPRGRRALDGHGALQRRGARRASPVGAAPGRRRAPQRRPGSGVVVPRAQRSGEHDDPGSAALQPAGRAQPPARAASRARSRAAAEASGRRRSSSPCSRCRAETSRRSRSPARSCGAPCMRSSPTSRPRASTSALASTSTRRCAARRAEGVALVVKSSDPLELAGLCDRVLVMSRGTDRRRDPGGGAERAADRRGHRRLEAARRARSPLQHRNGSVSARRPRQRGALGAKVPGLDAPCLPGPARYSGSGRTRPSRTTRS